MKKKVPEKKSASKKRAPSPDDLGEVLFNRILFEVSECATYIPRAQQTSFERLLLGMAETLEKVRAKHDATAIGAIDWRIRLALRDFTIHFLELFPKFNLHLAKLYRTCAECIREGTMPLGTRKLPSPPGPMPAVSPLSGSTARGLALGGG